MGILAEMSEGSAVVDDEVLTGLGSVAVGVEIVP